MKTSIIDLKYCDLISNRPFSQIPHCIFPTFCHSEQKCTVGCGTDALWGLWNGFIGIMAHIFDNLELPISQPGLCKAKSPHIHTPSQSTFHSSDERALLSPRLVMNGALPWRSLLGILSPCPNPVSNQWDSFEDRASVDIQSSYQLQSPDYTHERVSG